MEVGGGGGVSERRSVCWRKNLGDWSSVCWSNDFSEWGGVCWSDNLGDWSDSDSSFLVYDGVESVDGVSGVVDDTTAAIRFDEGVAALDNISVTALVLALGVTGESILDVVGVAVLWVWVVLVDGGVCYGDWGGVGNGDWGVGDGERGGVCPGGQWGGVSPGEQWGCQWGGVGPGGQGCSWSQDGWGADETSPSYCDESREGNNL